MREIDFIIDTHTELSRELIELDIRNQQAHKELQSYNDNGVFLNIHPLTIQKNFKDEEYVRLSKMKRENPEEFINEIKNNLQNISRIQSNISNKKYKSEEELKSWNENLHRAKNIKSILLKLLND